jgi:capsid assembly protease
VGEELTFNDLRRMILEGHREEIEALAEEIYIAETDGRIWAIRPELIGSLPALRHVASTLDTPETAAAVEAARQLSASPRVAGGVATIPLKGVLMPQVGLLSLLFGIGSGLTQFREALSQAAGDDEVGAIVMDIDSPGGLTDLIPEVAAEVRATRDKKPVVAVANTLAASAAYWIASQASEVVVTPSGNVGSIGVYAEHKDISGALAAAGINPTLISAGKYKVEGNPYEPLDDEAKAAAQMVVDDFYGMFTKDVALGRGVKQSDVKTGYGEGRVLGAKRAVEAGLADRVDTIGNVVAKLNGGSKPVARRPKAEGDPTPVAVSTEERARMAELALHGFSFPDQKEEQPA